MLHATPLFAALGARPLPSPRRSPAHSEFASLEAWLCSDPVRQLPLHEVESQQYPKGRELQRLLLQAHIQLRGIGDVGPALAVQHAGQPALHTLRRVHTRWLKTIFGTIPITRLGYSRRGADSIYPLDRDLQLPARCFSYELQKTLRFGCSAGTLPRIHRAHRRILGRLHTQTQPGTDPPRCGAG